MKKILLTALTLLLVFSLIQPIDAYFFKDHIYWTVDGFENVNSAITQRCRPHLEQVIGGLTSADVPVIHYFDEKVTSYIFTHQRNAYLTCQEEVAGDEELFCFCVGVALHQVHDFNSHNEGGLVTEYIRKYGASNIFGHMVIERSYEKKHQETLINDPISSQVEFYDSRVLDLLFEETGGDLKYLGLLNDISGIDMTQDARIMRSGYQGEGFFNTVYKDKVKLPFWTWALSGLLILFGLGGTIMILWFGKTNWKFIAIIFWLILLTLGIIIIYSLFTGTTWKITTFAIEQPPKLGYLHVTDKDIEFYNTKVKQATKSFLESGMLQVDDASGLSYVDRFGNNVKGPLKQSESTFRYIILPIFVTILVLINAYLLYKTKFRLRRNNIRKNPNN